MASITASEDVGAKDEFDGNFDPLCKRMLLSDQSFLGGKRTNILRRILN